MTTPPAPADPDLPASPALAPADGPSTAAAATVDAVPAQPPVPPPPADRDELVEIDRPTVTVARYADYPSAQRAVDYLSDNAFPVQRSAIVGTDLKLVETVLGRLTIGRAALAGAASGAWLGLFLGFLFTLFSASAWWTVLFTSLLIGLVWGAVFGAIAHALTGGRRDFTSSSTLKAGQYAIVVDAEVADEARTLLTRLNWNDSGAS